MLIRNQARNFTEVATAGACDSWRASLQRALICGEKGYLIGDLRTVRVQHARYASTADNGCDASQQGSFFGAYTPVTKALWKRRLEYLGVARDRELPPIVEKSAEPISVTYPFTTDTEFLEMVRHDARDHFTTPAHRLIQCLLGFPRECHAVSRHAVCRNIPLRNPDPCLLPQVRHQLVCHCCSTAILGIEFE